MLHRSCIFKFAILFPSSPLLLPPSPPSSISSSLLVSLYLRLHADCGVVTRNTPNVWRDMLIKFSSNLVIDPVTVTEVKEGLEFGRRVRLPSDLTFSTLNLAHLFASEGHVRPFQHLRWGTGTTVVMILIVFYFLTHHTPSLITSLTRHTPHSSHPHITHRHYIEVVVSYIPLELEFLNFVTQIRAEYDPWLKQAGGQNKLSSVSLQGTLSETLQEVRVFRQCSYLYHQNCCH